MIAPYLDYKPRPYNRLSYDERRSQIISFVREFWKQNLRAPSIREIRSGLEISSVSVVSNWVHRMVSDGYLENTGTTKSARGIRLPSMRVIFIDELEVPNDVRPRGVSRDTGKRGPKL